MKNPSIIENKNLNNSHQNSIKKIKEVLIVGNGISRLEHQDFIQKWSGEIWACNSAYLEYYNGSLPRLDLIIGDISALKEIVEYKKRYGGKYRIFGKNPKAKTLPGVEMIDIPGLFIKDSGSTLVARAIIKGYDKIYVIGFDLGGKDIYVQNHHIKNKEKWVRNWRLIRDELGLDKVIFIGKDHKPFIMSDEPSDYYAKLYLKGINHLEVNNKNAHIVLNEKVLILGNGKSRLQPSVKKFINKWRHRIWVCNEAYREVENVRTIKAVGCREKYMVDKALQYKLNNNYDYDIFTLKFDGFEEYENKQLGVFLFKEQRNWSTGILLVLQAIYEEFEEIVLGGFDFDNSNIYNSSEQNGALFKKQFLSVSKEFGIKNMSFIGKQPDFLI